ncbi:PREDICTED: uncharacterized protein LOC108358377 isoform X1 [Rhagoletis zephyria]|uniref:uncharacterized protein LOC108358377 isoform X1 n=1 Tax=Rhagoletis zephyria TaxID=28612 RepID=UPI0008114104|nr:PREDICTED: uncharacterized protein LOC108358377 isoform X1 [Rhagoletis zephyria]
MRKFLYSSYPFLINVKATDMDFNISFSSATNDTPITRKDLQSLEEKVLEQIRKSEKKIFKEIDHNQKSIKRSLTRILQERKQRKYSHKTSWNEIIPKTPFGNIEDFKKFEKEIKDHSSKYESLSEELSHIICTSSEKFIKMAWRKIVTDNAAQNLCWKGTNTKVAARSLSITAALKNVLSVKFPQSTDDELARTFITFFQHAKGRLLKRTVYQSNRNSSLET